MPTKKYIAILAVSILAIFIFSNAALAGPCDKIADSEIRFKCEIAQEGAKLWGSSSGGGFLVWAISKAIQLINTVLLAILTFLQWGTALALWLAEQAILESVKRLADINMVKTGWVALRDFANLFFIFILLVIAIATILRMENYGMKRLLPTLILVAIFINFSLLLTQLIIQPTNYAGLWFMHLIQGDNSDFATSVAQAFRLSALNNTKNLAQDPNQAQSSLQAGVDVFKKIFSEPLNGVEGQTALFLVLMAAIILFLVIIFISIAIAILVTIRTVILLFLMILSPMAFLFHVLPATKSYASQWWDKLISQALFLPVMLFFIWMGVLLSKDLPEFVGYDPENANPIFDPAFLYAFILVLMFFGAGLIAAQRLGAVGSGAVIRWGRRLGYGALGVAGGTAAYYTYQKVAHKVGESETMKGLSGREGMLGSTFGALRQTMQGVAKPVREVVERQARYKSERIREEKDDNKREEMFAAMTTKSQKDILKTFSGYELGKWMAGVTDKTKQERFRASLEHHLGTSDPEKIKKADEAHASALGLDLKKLEASLGNIPKHVEEMAVKNAQSGPLKTLWDEKDPYLLNQKLNTMSERMRLLALEAASPEQLQKQIQKADPINKAGLMHHIAEIDKNQTDKTKKRANDVLAFAPKFAAEFGKNIEEVIPSIDVKKIPKEELTPVMDAFFKKSNPQQVKDLLKKNDENSEEYIKKMQGLVAGIKAIPGAKPLKDELAEIFEKSYKNRPVGVLIATKQTFRKEVGIE